MSKYKLIHGDCIEQMKKMADNSVDAIVTDPPYEIGFMNKGWDSTGIAYNIEVWKQALRVLKPGGHMLAFSSTRTYHRMVCAIEDAGFEIRDQLAWIYSSGFPKSQDISKMIAKKDNNLKNTKTYMPDICDDRNVKNSSTGSPRCQMCDKSTGPIWKKCPDNRDDCIKPWEPDVQDNDWNGWGTALKPAQEPIVLARKPISTDTIIDNVLKYNTGAININDCRIGDDNKWPSNVIHDGSDEVLKAFPNQSDRFFYCAKANKQDRDKDNDHPTIKPTALMQYLITLIAPKGSTILDPFNGSGSTGKAAMILDKDYNYIGIDLNADYIKISTNRISAAIHTKQSSEFFVD
jgi:site-specific DNA-methyltransferase (adenine-specific)